jgi:hypothetical protein
MDSEDNYSITPINKSCSNVINKPIIQPQEGSTNAQTNQNLDDFHTQHQANTQYDNIGDVDIKPLYGGNKYEYTRHFKIIEINGEKVIISKRFSIKNNHTPIIAANNFLKYYKKIINDSEKITFKMKETTQGSKKKIYGY